MLAEFLRMLQLRQLCNHLLDDLSVISFGQQRGNARNSIGIRTKGFQEKAKSLQGWKFLFQEHQLSRGQLNRLRDEQALFLDCAGVQLLAELLKSDSLVGGVM